ncbi:RNA polymerase sigma factor [Massilia sp. MS-15]|uniref:RNA polymerase sigma factor n=1 Tax=Massilia sp. MS-15 TaxID=2878200 RepID=UPI001CD3355D|nr:sigma-70 family RNA polymerase sigma factor [Massilia sp. MS-15]MCA1247538.1 sigma-70 family RNA polymerase sigma factor [Massilia sp. MS-15]
MTAAIDTADHELLRQTHAGRADAFTALYRRHQGPLYRYALMRCGAPEMAADVVQDAFMGLLTGRFAFDPLRGQLQHFLVGVARKLILKLEAPRQCQVALPEPDEDGELDLDAAAEGAEPLARLLGNEAAEAVRQALGLLPPHYRDVVILFELHELSYQEIAAVCQLDIGTVRSRLSRGRAALAKRLKAHAPLPCLAH